MSLLVDALSLKSEFPTIHEGAGTRTVPAIKPSHVVPAHVATPP